MHGYSVPRVPEAIAGCVVLAANSASEGDLAANGATLQAAEFVVLQDGLFIPFGDWPNERGLQRWNIEAANRLLANLRKVAAGRPVYRGHPDVPWMKDDWPNKEAVGWISGGTVEAHNGQSGVMFKVKYNADGQDIVSQAKLKFPSPYWRLRVVETAANGERVIQPFELISIGLLNDPQIPVPAVANQRTPPQTGDTAMRDLLIQMLQAASVEVPDNATDAQLVELADGRITAANQAQAEAVQTAANATAQAEAHQTNAANARKSAAGAIVDLAIAQGKVPQAKRDEWLGKFETDFTAANSAIQVLDPILPLGGSKTGDLAKRNTDLQQQEAEAANARADFLVKVEEEKGRLGQTMTAANAQRVHEMAWGNVRRANADLYATAYPDKKEGAQNND